MEGVDTIPTGVTGVGVSALIEIVPSELTSVGTIVALTKCGVGLRLGLTVDVFGT